MKVDEMMKGTQDAITVGRVYGEAFEREGATFIPVANVSGDFAAAAIVRRWAAREPAAVLEGRLTPNAS